jgi:hypothetical protein
VSWLSARRPALDWARTGRLTPAFPIFALDFLFLHVNAAKIIAARGAM